MFAGGTPIALVAVMISPSAPLVLVVDDDAPSARVLARLLRGDGLEVEVAEGGNEALARLSVGPMPDAVVIDLKTQRSDGVSAAIYARLRSARIPVFVITAYPELLRQHREFDPILQVFPKPVEYADLKSALMAAWSATESGE